MRSRMKRANDAGNGADILSRLLAGEALLAQRLESAHDEADRIVREAGEYATRTEETCSATIEARLAERVASAERQVQDELVRVRADAEQELRRFESAAATRMPELVRLVLGELGVPGARAPVERAG